MDITLYLANRYMQNVHRYTIGKGRLQIEIHPSAYANIGDLLVFIGRKPSLRERPMKPHKWVDIKIAMKEYKMSMKRIGIKL